MATNTINKISQNNEELKEIMNQMKMIMGRIERNLVNINDRICVLEDKVAQISEETQKISEETQKMDAHVDFVTNLYQQVKLPFHYMIECVEKWTGHSQIPSVKINDQLFLTYTPKTNTN